MMIPIRGVNYIMIGEKMRRKRLLVNEREIQKEKGNDGKFIWRNFCLSTLSDYSIFWIQFEIMGNCLRQPNPGNQLHRINPQAQHCMQAKQPSKIYVAERQEISIAQMRPAISKQSKVKQLQEKENKPIICSAIQVNKTAQVSQQAGNEDVKKYIADLIKKSKKGLIILRQSSSLQNNQDHPEPQEPVSQQNTDSLPPNRLSFSYEVKAS